MQNRLRGSWRYLWFFLFLIFIPEISFSGQNTKSNITPSDKPALSIENLPGDVLALVLEKLPTLRTPSLISKSFHNLLKDNIRHFRNSKSQWDYYTSAREFDRNPAYRRRISVDFGSEAELEILFNSPKAQTLKELRLNFVMPNSLYQLNQDSYVVDTDRFIGVSLYYLNPAKSFEKVFENLSELPSLKSLELNYFAGGEPTVLADKDLKSLAQIMTTVIKTHPKLSKIDLSKNRLPLELFDYFIGSILEDITEIRLVRNRLKIGYQAQDRKIALYFNNIVLQRANENLFWSLIKKFPTLEKLTIRENPKLFAKNSAQFLDFFERQDRIKSLTLSKINLEYEFFSKLTPRIYNTKCLKKLDLAEITFPCETAKTEFFEYLWRLLRQHKTVKTLKLGGVLLDDQSFTKFAEILPNSNSLSRLKVNVGRHYYLFKPKALNEGAMSALETLLAKSPSLQDLYIDNNQISVDQAFWLVFFIKTSNHRIKNLYFKKPNQLTFHQVQELQLKTRYWDEKEWTHLELR